MSKKPKPRTRAMERALAKVRAKEAAKADEQLARTIAREHIADRFPNVTLTDAIPDGDGGFAIFVTVYVTDLDLEHARRDAKETP